MNRTKVIKGFINRVCKKVVVKKLRFSYATLPNKVQGEVSDTDIILGYPFLWEKAFPNLPRFAYTLTHRRSVFLKGRSVTISFFEKISLDDYIQALKEITC